MRTKISSRDSSTLTQSSLASSTRAASACSYVFLIVSITTLQAKHEKSSTKQVSIQKGDINLDVVIPRNIQAILKLPVDRTLEENCLIDFVNH